MFLSLRVRKNTRPGPGKSGNVKEYQKSHHPCVAVPHLGRRLEDVQADPALTVNVGVVDLGDEVD